MAKPDVSKLKDQAGRFLKKGKLDKALESYKELEKAAKNDLRITQKIAEIMLKMGEKDQAVAKYYEAAEKYHHKGFVVQAIAIYKVILDIVPNDPSAKRVLSELMQERTGPLLPKKKEIPGLKKKTPPPPPSPRPAAGEAGRMDVSDLGVPVEGEGDDAIVSMQDLGGEELGAGLGGEGLDLEEAGEDLDLSEPGEELGLADEAQELDAADLVEVGGDEEVEVDVGVVPLDDEEELPATGPEHTPLFSDLSAAEFDRVFELLISRVVEPGEVIISEGEEGTSIFILARGLARVSKTAGKGKEIELATLQPCDFFGEIGYFHRKRSATVTALKRCHLLEMTKEDLDSVVEDFPRVKEVLVKFYRERVMENLLAESPLFKSLSKDERETMRDSFEYREIRKGKVVVKEGDPGDSMFLIKSGEVSVSTVHPVKGEKVHLATLRGGDFFGEVSLVKQKPRTATIIAQKDTELMELSRDAFQQVAALHNDIGKAVEQTIEQRVEDTIKKMISTLEE